MTKKDFFEKYDGFYEKRTKLSDKDFNALQECANKVFAHSDDWFYEKYFKRKTVELDDLQDLLTASDSAGLDRQLTVEKLQNPIIKKVWNTV